MKRKIDNRDFTYDLLPKTRREQFFQIIKDNYLLFIKVGFLCLLFLLPFIFSFFFKESFLRSVSNEASMTAEEKERMFILLENIFNAIYILCSVVFFIGLGGILKILRRLIWNEPIFFKEDFLLGIKDNIGHNLITGFMFGLLNYTSVLLYRFLDADYHYVSYIFAGISLAIIIPILLLACFLGSIFKNKFKVSCTISFRLFVRKGFLFLLPILIIYSLYFISIIPLGTIYLVLFFIIIFVFLLPLILLMSYIVFIKILDDKINSYYYPDKAYLGLYISDEKKKQIEENSKLADQENSL